MNEELKAAFDEVAGLVKTLAETVKVQGEQQVAMQGTAMTEEKVQRIMADFLVAQENQRRVAARSARLPWVTSDANLDSMNPMGVSHHALLPEKPTLQKAVFMTEPELKTRFTGDRVADIKGFQKLWDDVYLLSMIRKCPPSELVGEEYQLYKRLQEQGYAINKAMDTGTAGEGYEWVATAMSADMVEMVHLAYRVANLFEHFPQPVKIYPWPIQTSDLTPYYVPESADDNSEKIPASTMGTSNTTFTARKFAGRTLVSTEGLEDFIIPILPALKQGLADALVFGVEDCIINGDRTSPHQDTDVLNAKDARKAFTGIRKYTQAGAKTSLATFNASNMRAVRKTMGKFGVMPVEQLVWIVPVCAMAKILDFDEVKTMDKYGPLASVLTGEIGKLDGISIVASEKVRENLNDAGTYDGMTTTKTIVQLVWRPGFKIGDRRLITVKTDEDIETDQILAVGTQRLDFEPMRPYASEYIVAQGYNITS